MPTVPSKSLHSIPFGLFIIFAPSYDILGFVVDRYDDKRIAELFILFLGLISILTARSLRVGLLSLLRNLSLGVRVLLMTLILSATVSLSNAEIPRYALLDSSLYVALLLWGGLVAVCSQSNRTLFQRLALCILIGSALIYSITVFTSYFGAMLLGHELRFPEPFSGFSNVRFFNQYQSFTLVLVSLPVLIYPDMNRLLRRGLLCLSVGWLILLLASKSRGGLFAHLAVLCLAGMIFRRQAIPLLKLNAGLFIAALAGFWLLFYVVPEGLNDYVFGWRSSQVVGQGVDQPRLVLWRSAVALMLQNPWFGAGGMHYAYYPQLEMLSHPHNSVLQWGAEYGLLSMFLVVWLVVRGVYSWVRQTRCLPVEQAGQVPLRIALFCSLVTGLLLSLVSGVIVMPMSQLMLVFVFGWMLGLYVRVLRSGGGNGNTGVERGGLAGGQSDQKNQISHWILQLFAGGVLVALTCSVLPDLIPRVTGQEEFLDHYYDARGPRFWQQGGIPQ